MTRLTETDAAVRSPPTPAPVRPSRARKGRAGAMWLPAVPFVAPALTMYGLFLIVPLLGTILLSVTHWNGFSFSQIRFAGLHNYREMVHDTVFVHALVHNILFMVGAVVLKTVVALGLALILDRKLPLTRLFQGIYIMPAVLSLVVLGVVFSLALSPTLGLINPFVKAIGLGGLAGEWLGDPNRVLPILILVDVWQGFGLYMLLFIARLGAVPQDLRDAAAVDGAGLRAEIRHVLLPQLKSTTMMVILLAMIESLKVFALVFTMTKGGPNHASEMLSTWGYFQGFTANNVGYGAAILVVLLVLTFILAYIQVTRFRVQND
jgi:raffinose/stachyose/melibiose transport system permease protein